MNRAPEPLNPDAVDLLLSAELDGELEAASADLGLGLPEAIAQLEATPGVAARRAALARARDLIATAPALDAAVAAQLIEKAKAGDVASIARRRDRRARQWRVLVATGSVAAAIAAIVAISSTHDNHASKSSAIATAPVTGSQSESTAAHTNASAGSPKTADFGDITNPAALRAPARALYDNPLGNGGTQRPETQTSATKSDSAPTSAASSKPEVPSAVSAEPVPSIAKRASGFDARVAPDCASLVEQRYGISGSPVINGTGTVSGAPVRVLVFDDAGTPVAYVVSARDCSLVRKQPLG